MDHQVVADYQCHTGECPVWHELAGAVYWIDITTGRLFRYFPKEDRHEVCYSGDPLRAITVEDDGAVLLFHETGSVVRWVDGRTEPVPVDLPYIDGFRFNDVTADPRGRVFCGVFPTEERNGGVYRLTSDSSMARVLDDVEFPNGMAFAPDEQFFYFTDTRANAIYKFDYEAASGELSNRRLFVDTTDDVGFPDGLTVDAEGYVWSARWDGGRVVRYDTEGAEVASYEFPAKKVTSLVFAGDDYSEGYLTTALASSNDPIGTKADQGSAAGALIRVAFDVVGIPPFYSTIVS